MSRIGVALFVFSIPTTDRQTHCPLAASGGRQLLGSSLIVGRPHRTFAFLPPVSSLRFCRRNQWVPSFDRTKSNVSDAHQGRSFLFLITHLAQPF
jgi:hypothetical protein